MPHVPADAGVLLPLLIALTAVIVTGRLLGRVFAAIGQPPVIGEVIAGVVLGPSVLGALWPAAGAFILPASVAPSLSVVAQLGVILYMFLVGLELNPDALRGQLRSTVAISQTSIVVPFALGSALAVYLYPRFSSNDVPFVSFALFLGIAMSITAFPVLARILSDLGMTRTPLGVVALTCAAIDDVTAWCLLALVVGVVQASAGSALATIVLTLAFIAAMFIVVRPIVVRLIRSAGERETSRGVIALTIAAMLVSALITESIGVNVRAGVPVPAAAKVSDESVHARAGRVERVDHVVAAFDRPRGGRLVSAERSRNRIVTPDRLIRTFEPAVPSDEIVRQLIVTPWPRGGQPSVAIAHEFFARHDSGSAAAIRLRRGESGAETPITARVHEDVYREMPRLRFAPSTGTAPPGACAASASAASGWVVLVRPVRRCRTAPQPSIPARQSANRATRTRAESTFGGACAWRSAARSPAG